MAAGLALHGALDSSMGPCPNPGSLLAEGTDRCLAISTHRARRAHGTSRFLASARYGARAPSSPWKSSCHWMPSARPPGSRRADRRSRTAQVSSCRLTARARVSVVRREKIGLEVLGRLMSHVHAVDRDPEPKAPLRNVGSWSRPVHAGRQGSHVHACAASCSRATSTIPILMA